MLTDRITDGQNEGWMEGWMDKRTERTNENYIPCRGYNNVSSADVLKTKAYLKHGPKLSQ